MAGFLGAGFLGASLMFLRSALDASPFYHDLKIETNVYLMISEERPAEKSGTHRGGMGVRASEIA